MDTTPHGPEPAGENTVNSFIVCDGAGALIAFLTEVFDATETADARTPDMFAADDTLIHAEVRIGNSTLMLADRKPDWPFTPALLQVYVDDAAQTLRRAVARRATVVTEVSPFYGGYELARFLDPWHNLWWLFAPAQDADSSAQEWDEQEWDEESWAVPSEPDQVYTTLLAAMRGLTQPYQVNGSSAR